MGGAGIFGRAGLPSAIVFFVGKRVGQG